MLRNASSTRVIKSWRVLAGKVASWVELSVYVEGCQRHVITYNITGASPAYVETLIESLNININNLLYELGRIPR
ncbi:hypothetical protein D9M71_464760 [compost metagenome]